VAATLLHKAEAEIRSAGHQRGWLAASPGHQRAVVLFALRMARFGRDNVRCRD